MDRKQCANGAKPISLGQRPRNTATHKFIRPEGATRGTGNAQARDREQTIAGDVAEILEACGLQIMASGMAGHDRVWPLQGGGDLFGPSSQGVALGWRVVAPLARQTATTPTMFLARKNGCANGAKPISLGQRPRNTANVIPSPNGAKPISLGHRPRNTANVIPSPNGAQPVSPGQRPRNTANVIPSPNGAKPISPGQRPGNSANHNMVSPEGATHGAAQNPARDLEPTIAGDVANNPSANGANSSQPGASPQVHGQPFHQGPTARSIAGNVAEILSA